ncbi:hypothetical protein DFP72DRAFT_1047902 [Ephemerocybe angulata]|uniref:F-box domain-containing protein n=1 Tax=Ephemerocybe angulata TaxID=980116 RepID=A0A8H6HRE9_9AGAR|nr:hypothetical protein DFP72DRAFT_1047902 [Tulosesus angulatus]
MAALRLSSLWRETAIAAPDLWRNIQIRGFTKAQYLNFALGNIGEKSEAIHVDAYDFYKNLNGLRRILEMGKKWVLKRVSLTGHEPDIHLLFQGLDACSEGTEELELGSFQHRGWGDNLPTLQVVATVFPQLRKLCLVSWRIPSDLHQLSTVTDFAFKVIRELTVEELRKLFTFIKSAGHIMASLELRFLKTEAVFPENILGSDRVKLNRLKSLKIHAHNTPILLALLNAMRLPAEIEVVDVITRDNNNALSLQLTSALSLACSHILAPERVVLASVTTRPGDVKTLSGHVAFGGWRSGKADQLLQLIMGVPKDNTIPNQIRQTYSLPFTSSTNPWLFSRLEGLKITFEPNYAFWKLIAGVPTLRRLKVKAFHLDDCLLRILQGDDARNPSPPFSPLRSLEITFATPDMDIGYARALAHALKYRKLAPIREISFNLCMSHIDMETNDLLSSVALNINWFIVTPKAFLFTMAITASESQISLDREIAQLEKNLASLKRRRNALSPVSRLPPEILARIFFLTLPFAEIAERRLRTEDEPRLEQTKGRLCAVSSRWRETAFAAPELWRDIHIRDRTKAQYLKFALENIGEKQAINLDAYNVDENIPEVRRILEAGNTRVLKRVSLSAEEEAVHRIFQDLEARSQGTEELELRSLQGRGRLANLQTVATVFPQLRKLRLLNWRIPNDLHQLTMVTHLAFKGIRGLTVEDLRKLFAFFKTAGHIESLELQFQKTAAVFPENILGSAEVELHHLKRLKVQADNTLILLALLKAIRLPAEIELVDIATFDNNNELSHQLTSAVSLACSHILPPEDLGVSKVIALTPDGAKQLPHYVGFQGFWSGKPKQFLTVVMEVPKDNAIPSNPNSQICQLYSLPLTSSANPWLLSRLQEISIGLQPNFAFWQLIADIPTLRRLKLDAWHLDDCFLRILRGDEDTHSPSVPRIPFPVLQSLEISIFTPDLDIDYARALAHALKRRTAGAGEGKLAPIREINFKLCTLEIDEETDVLLLSVASDITWLMKE